MIDDQSLESSFEDLKVQVQQVSDSAEALPIATNEYHLAVHYTAPAPEVALQ